MSDYRFVVVLGVFVLSLVAFAGEGWAMSVEDIPMAAPQDEIMASGEEVKQMAAWAAKVFAGEETGSHGPPVAIEVVRQDYNTLHFGQSCMDTPVVIGSRTFAHGLGTHANSELVLQAPAGAVRFEAFAGIDNNYDTDGKRGSAEFSVEIGGAEAARTPVLRGGDEAHAVAVDLPEGTKQITLKVGTTEDGPSHDQSDWADARFILADGTTVWVDEGHRNTSMAEEHAPFSFTYDGKDSGTFLGEWTRTVEVVDGEVFRTYEVTWVEPGPGLAVTAEVKVFKAYPASDWVLHFENRGTADTPVIEDIRALDLGLRAGGPKTPAVVGHNRGDVFGEGSFENLETALEAGKGFSLAPINGRSSNGAFPFFDVRFGGNTLVAAVGWSGQWAVNVDRDTDAAIRVRAGMERTHLALHPGERIRSPRIVLTANTCDPDTAHNRFRRLVLFHYVPKQDGRPVAPPVALQCFDRYSWTVPEWATEAGQIDAANQAADLGFDTHWFDAAWFVGGFPNGVGNWFPKPEAFPHGLRPVGDACHARGIQFLLWYEPERVAVNTQIANEHPDFVFGGEKGGLFRLDLPEARQWLTDLLSAQIEEYGLDVYRNDFNIDPLGFWQGNDEENRQGMTEIRYVEGLYAMWDDLLARHPGLVIDNCASGGRRIDLELCMRSIPLWRSDTNCFSGNADWNPGHSAGISYYLPLHTACAWAPAPYEVRAATTAGLICQLPYLDKDFPREEARRLIEEAKGLQKYWYGDVYPLTLGLTGPEQWCALQLHRADLDEGVVMFFRRVESPYTGMDVALRALDGGAAYWVERVAEDGTVAREEMTGEGLMTRLEANLEKRASSLVVRYGKAK